MKMGILICLLFLATGIQAQSIKKMNIDELYQYIAKNDKPLIVNFWATFCKPCVEEIPYFESLIKACYLGRVDLVLVSLDARGYYPRMISSFAENRKFTAPIIWLNETDANYFCRKISPGWSGSIPATLMVDNKKGIRKFYDRQLTPLQVEKELKQLLEL